MERFLGHREIIGKSSSAYTRLRGMIVRGEVKPDRRLPPKELAAYFSVSITPVRDALARLAAEGFVNWEVNRGYFTKPLTVIEQGQLLDLNAILFQACVHRALPHLTEADQAAISSIITSAARDPSPLTQVIAQEALNHRLADATQNPTLANIYKISLDRTHLLRRMDTQSQQDRELSAHALRLVGHTIRRGDVDGLIHLVHTVITERTKRLPELVDKANAWALRSHFP